MLALLALSFINPDEIDYCRARNAAPGEGAKPQTLRYLVRDRTLFYFIICLVLFQFADASVFPLVSENIGTNKTETSSLQVTGLIVTAQLVVMLLARGVGYLSEGYGRKPLLVLGFGLEIHSFGTVLRHNKLWFLISRSAPGGVTGAICNLLSRCDDN